MQAKGKINRSFYSGGLIDNSKVRDHIEAHIYAAHKVLGTQNVNDSNVCVHDAMISSSEYLFGERFDGVCNHIAISIVSEKVSTVTIRHTIKNSLTGESLTVDEQV